MTSIFKTNDQFYAGVNHWLGVVTRNLLVTVNTINGYSLDNTDLLDNMWLLSSASKVRYFALFM
jgi:hypothetical protein